MIPQVQLGDFGRYWNKEKTKDKAVQLRETPVFAIIPKKDLFTQVFFYTAKTAQHLRSFSFYISYNTADDIYSSPLKW